MKKNMVLIMSGFVTLLFVICIGYVFTSPTPKTEIPQIDLQEQDASSLSESNSLTSDQTPPLDSTNSLVFNANANNTDITTPPIPLEKTEEKFPPVMSSTQSSSSSTTPQTEKKYEIAENAIPLENTSQPQDLFPLDKEEVIIQENPYEKTEDNTKTNINQNIEEKQEKKTIIQDKLPVPFVEDSLKTHTILAPKKNANTIIYAELLMDGNQVGLVIEGDKPIKPKTFRLQNPDRVVVDIEGSWIIKLPRLISNRMVKEIRSNMQQDKTRIVFDLKIPVTSSLLYRIHSRKYQLVFK